MDDQLLLITMQQEEDDREPLPAGHCPYCEKPLIGPTINGLHKECDDRMHEEMDTIWGPVQEIIE